MIWYFHLLKNFPWYIVIHTVKGFSIVNKADVDVFLEFSCFFCNSTDVGNLILIPLPLGFPCGSGSKESAHNEGDLGSIPGLGRSPGEGQGFPLQYSGLENPMGYIVHEVTKSRTRLSDFHFHFSFPILGCG